MKQCQVHKFDCDAGYLVKSPCQDCGNYGLFPDCMDRCAVLDRIQTASSDRIVTTRNFSAFENFTVQA
jgi:hypothetical protein